MRTIIRAVLVVGAAVAAAVAAASVVGAQGSQGCPDGTADLGTWCLSAGFEQVDDNSPQGSYLQATQACIGRGGYLPTAEMLVGAAGRVSLAGRLDDNPATASVDTDAGDGLQDRREMSATLITTRAGSNAAGSLGTSDRSTGDPRTGEPVPPSEPADLEPVTLQYVTVVDNGNRGGFSGAAVDPSTDW